MASKYRSQMAASIKMNQPNCWIEVSVSYNEGGGMTYSGNINARGFYLHLTPAVIEGNSKTTTIEPGYRGGGKIFLEEATRFSQKKLDTLAGRALDHPQLPQIIQRIAEARKWTIAPGEKFENTNPQPAETSA